jgi:uroporphyrinogen-III synthase
MKRVILTGPLESLTEYAAAARAAGWEPIEWPLLRIVSHRHEVTAIRAQRFDWICITSSSALDFLVELSAAADDLRAARCAVVGERSSSRAREAGLRVDLTSTSAADLGSELARIARAGDRVLWPRGHLTNELARDLRSRGFLVLDPVVYATDPIAHAHRPPAAEAVLFASPSGVRAWHERRPSTDEIAASASPSEPHGAKDRPPHESSARSRPPDKSTALSPPPNMRSFATTSSHRRASPSHSAAPRSTR